MGVNVNLWEVDMIDNKDHRGWAEVLKERGRDLITLNFARVRMKL